MESVRVYIAEADNALQHHLATALDTNGYKVELFDRGYPIAALMDHWPDIFLINIELPDINGIELCSWLKSHDSSKAIPVILISRESYLTILAASSSADGFLETPFDVSDLIHKINGCLEGIGSIYKV